VLVRRCVRKLCLDAGLNCDFKFESHEISELVVWYKWDENWILH